jgi:hypothetical protein
VFPVPVTVAGVALIELPYATVSPYSNVTVAARLLAFTVPFSVAVVVPILVAAEVAGVDAIHDVVKVRSLPLTVDPQFVPTTLK